MSNAQKLYLRNSVYRRWDEEFDRLSAFYSQNPAPQLSRRDPIQLIHSIKNNQLYKIEDSNDHLRGVSFCFSHGSRYTESGGTLITLNGFGLQRYLHMTRILNEYLMKPPKEAYFCAILSSNHKSISNTQRSGFAPWQPNSLFFHHVGISEEEVRQRDLLIYRVLRKFVIVSAVELLRLYENPIIEHRISDRQIRIILDFPLFTNDSLREGVVRRIANGEVSDPFI